MKVQSSVRARLCGVAFLMALAAGCGGGDGGDAGLGPGPGAPPPAGPPAGPPAVPEVRGWSQPFGSAAVVLGQSAFTQDDPGAGTALRSPRGGPVVTADGKLLVVAGGEMNVFSNYEGGNGPVADASFNFIYNQSSASPLDVSVQGEKLVAPISHGFVLIYNQVPTSAAEADVTVGAGLGCGRALVRDPQAAHLTATDAPQGQRLIVADTLNHRVLIWFNVPAAGPMGDADRVLGQANMDTCEANDDGAGPGIPSLRTLSQPTSVWSDGVRLVVADTGNHRVLVWDDIQNVLDFQAADHVIGQHDPSGSSPNAGQDIPSASSLFSPTYVDVSAAGELAVTDRGNSRILIWSEIPTSDSQAAQFVVGKPDFLHAGVLPTSAKTLLGPEGARFHGRNLIVNDGGNNRVMVWRESD